jgi:hypothetical protein
MKQGAQGYLIKGEIDLDEIDARREYQLESLLPRYCGTDCGP